MDEMTFEKLQKTMLEIEKSEYEEVYKYFQKLRDEEIEKELEKLREEEYDRVLREAVFHYLIEPLQPPPYFSCILV